MERRKWAAVIISVIFISVSVGTVAMMYSNEANISPFRLNTSYFNPQVNASYFLKTDTGNFTSFYNPIVKSLETNCTEKTLNFSFGEYTLLMTPNLTPVPTGSINLYHYESSLNLSASPDPISFMEPNFGIALVNVTSGNPGSLGFQPIQAKVTAPNGSGYVFNMRGESPSLSETIPAYPVNIGPYYNVGTGGIRPTNYSMRLMPGQYTLQVTVSLYHFLSIGYAHLTDLSFTLPYYNFIEK